MPSMKVPWAKVTITDAELLRKLARANARIAELEKRKHGWADLAAALEREVGEYKTDLERLHRIEGAATKAVEELERFTHTGAGSTKAYRGPHGRGLIVDYGPAKQMVREVVASLRAALERVEAQRVREEVAPIQTDP